MGKQILDLDALAPDRPTVRLRTSIFPEGMQYELRVQRELSLEQLTTLQRLGNQAAEIQKLGVELDDESINLLNRYLDDLLRIAFVADYDEKIAPMLTVFHKADIARAFSEACLGIDPAQMGMPNRETRRASTKKKPTGGS